MCRSWQPLQQLLLIFLSPSAIAALFRAFLANIVMAAAVTLFTAQMAITIDNAVRYRTFAIPFRLQALNNGSFWHVFALVFPTAFLTFEFKQLSFACLAATAGNCSTLHIASREEFHLTTFALAGEICAPDFKAKQIF